MIIRWGNQPHLIKKHEREKKCFCVTFEINISKRSRCSARYYEPVPKNEWKHLRIM
jgi:hypothetical protein